MKTNGELKIDVRNETKRVPQLDAVPIGTKAKEGIAILTGTIDGSCEKTEAEAAKHLAGVNPIDEKMALRFNGAIIKSDEEIAGEILKALKNSWLVPDEKISVKVKNGHVTLEGTLAWNYQRETAKDNILFLEGVTGITNNIMIESEVKEAAAMHAVKALTPRSSNSTPANKKNNL